MGFLHATEFCIFIMCYSGSLHLILLSETSEYSIEQFSIAIDEVSVDGTDHCCFMAQAYLKHQNIFVHFV